MSSSMTPVTESSRWTADADPDNWTEIRRSPEVCWMRTVSIWPSPSKSPSADCGRACGWNGVKVAECPRTTEPAASVMAVSTTPIGRRGRCLSRAMSQDALDPEERAQYGKHDDSRSSYLSDESFGAIFRAAALSFGRQSSLPMPGRCCYSDWHR